MYPPPDQLLATFHKTFDSLTSFIRANHIITIPTMCSRRSKKRRHLCGQRRLRQ